MKTLLATGAVFLSAATLFAQPSLRATNPIVNGGSYAASIAPGSIFVAFGTNLSGANIVQASALPLTTSMNGTSIRFTPAGGGAAVDALMVYTTQNQIAGLLPSTAAAGSYSVTVTYNGRTSTAGTATVVARNFGIVTAANSGAGQAQVQNYRTATDWDLNRFAKGQLPGTILTTSPAAPGQVLVIWGTGLGADARSDTSGGTSGDVTSSANVRVIVGDKEFAPGYAGRAQFLPGTDQINITLPPDVQLGCSVPLQVRVGSTLSNAVTLSIAQPGADACTHPFLSADALRQISQGGSVVLGSLSLAKLGVSISAAGLTLDTTTETANGSFARYDVSNLADYSSAFLPPGTCQVYRRIGSQQDVLVGVPPATPLDAGAQLTLSGPNANNIAIPRNQGKTYNATLATVTSGLPGGIPLPGGGGSTPVISAGTYTIAGTGGADIGAFSASLTVPTPITWTNAGSITAVNRSQGVTVTWSGGGSNTVEIVGISGNTVSGGSAANPVIDAAIFICFASASAGTFNVPSSILTQLPANSGDLTGGSVGLLGVQLLVPGAKFSAPLTAGGNIDYGGFGLTSGSNKTVAYQ